MMKEFTIISRSLEELISQWEPILAALPEDIIKNRKNNQNRTIKQILGHMVDSATNNLHRVVHLQYQPSPLIYPDYANFGNNDRWIALQNYQDEDWQNLVQLWKFINLHYAHVILFVKNDALNNVWITGNNQHVSLPEMILDYLRHFNLHLSEIDELIAKP